MVCFWNITNPGLADPHIVATVEENEQARYTRRSCWPDWTRNAIEAHALDAKHSGHLHRMFHQPGSRLTFSARSCCAP